VAVEAVKSRWFCYMLLCRDGSFYVGAAIDPEERVNRHNWGVGARHTATRRPVTLVWTEEQPDQKAARSREAELKGWSRKKKLGLIDEYRRFHSSPKPGSE
jgi:predicted GIY-YIG superfamily endonuclease